MKKINCKIKIVQGQEFDNVKLNKINQVGLWSISGKVPVWMVDYVCVWFHEEADSHDTNLHSFPEAVPVNI